MNLNFNSDNSLEDINNIEFKRILLFFYNCQLIYLIINILSQKYVIQALIDYLKASEFLITYYPVIQHYFSNPIFYTAMLVVIQFVLLPLILLISSRVISLLIKFTLIDVYKPLLILTALIPFILAIPAFVLSYAILAFFVGNYYVWKLLKRNNLRATVTVSVFLLLIHLPAAIAYFML